MMRKALSTLLACLLIALPLYAAAAPEGMIEYEDVKLGVVYLVGESWFEMNDGNIELLRSLATNLMDTTGMEATIAAMQSTPMTLFYSDSLIWSINIVKEENPGMTMPLMLMLRSMLLDGMTAQYSALYGDVSIEADEELYAAGDNQYFVLHVATDGLNMNQYLTVLGDYLFTITVTTPDAFDPAQIEALLASLRAL